LIYAYPSEPFLYAEWAYMGRQAITIWYG
jgi:hypothetical protein